MTEDGVVELLLWRTGCEQVGFIFASSPHNKQPASQPAAAAAARLHSLLLADASSSSSQTLVVRLWSWLWQDDTDRQRGRACLPCRRPGESHAPVLYDFYPLLTDV